MISMVLSSRCCAWASAGMVLTDLLLQGAPVAARRFFNALAEEPDTVAAVLVPQIRSIQVGRLHPAVTACTVPVQQGLGLMQEGFLSQKPQKQPGWSVALWGMHCLLVLPVLLVTPSCSAALSWKGITRRIYVLECVTAHYALSSTSREACGDLCARRLAYASQ